MTTTTGRTCRTREINGDANSLDEAKATLEAVKATLQDTVAGHDQAIASLTQLNVTHGTPTRDPVTLLGIKKERRVLLVEQVQRRVARIVKLIAEQEAYIAAHPELEESLRNTGSWLARH